MNINEEKCLQTLNEIENLLGKDQFLEIVETTSKDLEQLNSANRYFYILKALLDHEKGFSFKLNIMFGYKRFKKKRIRQRLESKYTGTNITPYIHFLSHKNMSVDVLDSISSICRKTQSKKDKYKNVLFDFYNSEVRYVAKLHQILQSHIILEQQGFVLPEIKTIRGIYNLHQSINKKIFAELGSNDTMRLRIYRHFKKRFIRLERLYVDFFANFDRIYEFFTQNAAAIPAYIFNTCKNESILSNEGRKKEIDLLILTPVSHMLHYRFWFDLIGRLCFSKYDSCYHILSSCFDVIIQMANDKRLTVDTQTFFNGISDRIQNKPLFVHDSRAMKCGDLRFHVLSSILLNEECAKRLCLFYSASLQFFTCDRGEFFYEHTYKYSQVRKYKVYDKKDVYLKVVFDTHPPQTAVFLLQNINTAKKIIALMESVVKSRHNNYNRHENIQDVSESVVKSKYNHYNRPENIQDVPDSVVKLRHNNYNRPEKNQDTSYSPKIKNRSMLNYSLKDANIRNNKGKNKIVEKIQKITVSKNIVAKIEFGSINALTLINTNECLDSFQRKIITEIGRNLLNEKNINEDLIILQDFSHFKFYVKEEGYLYSILSEKSLKAALLLAQEKSKLLIVVKRAETKNEIITLKKT